ncbi:SAM-dependent methyltransferase [Streptomyces mexicanus]|jgi:methyltransferase (TIGR00027 family)|uniref:SAM-dependent methyltransferase n=1 Tax=Streptomyces mexicanus TaxID=178566 RepID=UPI00369F6C11
MNDGPTSRFSAGVALTALVAAAARAIETRHPEGLIADPYAEFFVRAAETPVRLPVSPDEVEEAEAGPLWGRGQQYFALRTRVFDDFLQDCAHHGGIRQLVMLGAGLDTRALRLDWPTDCVVYEVDRFDLFAFKQDVLDAMGARAAVAHQHVIADLESNWARNMRAAGFDPARPTAWVIEGVIPYMPGLVERSLLATVSVLSAPGSALAYEILQAHDAAKIRANSLYAQMEQRVGVHLSGLLSDDARPDSAGALAAAGWEMSEESVYRFTEQYGRGPAAGADDSIACARWVMGYRRRRHGN